MSRVTSSASTAASPPGKRRSQRLVTTPVAIVAALLGAATFAYRALAFNGFPNDHFVHLAAAQQIVFGALPVRDFVERGLPLMELVSAGAQRVSEGLPSELIVVALGFALAAASTMVAVYVVSRSLVVALGLAVASVLIFPVSYAYPKILTYATALVAAGLYAIAPRSSRAIGLGVVAAVAFLFRHDHGVLIVGAALIFMLAQHGMSLTALQRIAIVTVVALTVASPYLVWVQIHGGLAAYVSDGIRFSAREAERSALDGLPPLSLVALIFYLAWSLPLAALVWLLSQWRRVPDAVRAPAAMTVALQLAMNLTLLRDPLNLRVRDVIVPVCVLAGFLLGSAWHARANTATRTTLRLVAIGAVVAFAIGCGAIGEAPDRLHDMHASDGWRGLGQRTHELVRRLAPPNERTGDGFVSPAYRSLTEFISGCTPAGSRILALTFAPELFFYSGRGFAGGQPALTAGYYKTDRDAEIMLLRVSKEHVPLVIMDSETAEEMAQGYPRIVDYVRSRYHEVSRTTIGKGKDFILLAENDRRFERASGHAELPCSAPRLVSAIPGG